MATSASRCEMYICFFFYHIIIIPELLPERNTPDSHINADFGLIALHLFSKSLCVKPQKKKKISSSIISPKPFCLTPFVWLRDSLTVLCQSDAVPEQLTLMIDRWQRNSLLHHCASCHLENFFFLRAPYDPPHLLQNNFPPRSKSSVPHVSHGCRG